uniref:phage portal protein n=1 Tax=Cohaesibacter celericrescens TaxID=2067669 RepID=UPI003568EEA3
MKMNIIDRTVSYFSPLAGVNRVRARLALDGVRSYDGAKHGRNTAGWDARQTGANTEIGRDLATLRARSRDLIRNNPFAEKAQRVWVNNTVGPDGIMPRVVDDAYDDLMNWSDECDPERVSDLAGLETLISSAIFESGSALVRQIAVHPREGLHIPLQLQVIEPDYLDHGKNDDIKNGRIVNGVEYDLSGRRVAYWLFKDHPGERVNFGRYGVQSIRVPADQFMHIYERTRPGQVHGVPALASSLTRWRDTDNYETAVDQRKAIEACMAAFVTGGDSDDVAAVAKAMGTEANEEVILQKLLGSDLVGLLEPGAIFGLPGNLKVESFTPPASEDSGYLKHKYRGLADGGNITEMQLTGDMSQANYSSMRGGLIEARLDFRRFQKQVLAHQFVRPCWRSVLATGKLVGRFSGIKPGYRPEITWPVFESIDPLKDVMADLIEVRSG